MKTKRTSLFATLAFLAAFAVQGAAPLQAQPEKSPATEASGADAALSEATLARLGRPLVIGISGDSGSGKTTVAKALQRKFGKNRTVVLSTDDWHSLDRKQRARKKVTALNPVATNFDLLAKHVAALRSGKTISKPIYDHSDGTIKQNAEKVKPRPVIIVEGLHPLQNEKVRRHLDYKIFVSPSKEVKTQWKIARDVGDRGYSEAEVREKIAERQPDFRKYINPQRENADLIIEYEVGSSPDEPQTFLRERGKKKRTRVRGGKRGLLRGVSGRIARSAERLAGRSGRSKRAERSQSEKAKRRVKKRIARKRVLQRLKTRARGSKARSRARARNADAGYKAKKKVEKRARKSRARRGRARGR